MKKLLLFICLVLSIFLVAAIYKINNGINNRHYTILSKSKNEHGTIWIYDVDGTRCMSHHKPITKINFSCLYLKNPDHLVFYYNKIMMGSFLLAANYKKILIVGLGGGSIVNAVSDLFPNTQIDVVEINNFMISLAQKYFNFKIKENVKVIIDDGFHFIKNTEDAKYDIIILDAFTPEYIPPSFLTKEFMVNLKRILTKDGVVGSNLFVKSKYKEEELYESFFGNNIIILSNEGNKIIFATNGKLPELSEIISRGNNFRENFAKIGVDTNWLVNMFSPQ